MDNDEFKKIARLKSARWALNALAEAAQHIRTCNRCERIFLTAYDAYTERLAEGERANSEMQYAMHPSDVWSMTKEILVDLRQCESWPKMA